MGARAFDWLPALVEHRARVVFKTELVDLDWPGVVVEEKNLLVHISCLRKVFELQTIATITERGNLLTAAFDGAVPGAAVAAAPSPCPTPASGDETAAYLLNLSIMFVPPPATSKVSRCTTALGHQIPQLAVPQWVERRHSFAQRERLHSISSGHSPGLGKRPIMADGVESLAPEPSA